MIHISRQQITHEVTDGSKALPGSRPRRTPRRLASVPTQLVEPMINSVNRAPMG